MEYVSEISRLLLDIFGIRNDVYAVGTCENGTLAYRPIKDALSDELVQQHLEGTITLGTYSLSIDSRVNWLGWDIDSQDDNEARRIVSAIREKLYSLPHVVEFSGGKGYHVLVFLSEPLEALRAKEFVDSIRESAGIAASGSSHCECFPKQAMLTISSPFGSLLKMPLGAHPRTGRRSIFVDPDSWQEIDPLPFLRSRVDPLQLMLLIPASTPEDRIAEILSQHWKEGQRHNLSLALSGLLATMGWNSESVCTVMQRICERTGDSEIEDRIRSVQDTYKRRASRQSTAGYSILADIMPSPQMHVLLEIAAVQVGEIGIRRIDEIRMRRDAEWSKVRLAESTIYADTSSTGLWVKTTPGDNGNLYYLDGQSHRLYQAIQSPGFDSTIMQLLHKKFGLNPADGFSKKAYAGLTTRAMENAQAAPVRRRSYWDGSRLFVNLGGPEVYVLDGYKIELSYNGECGHIFESLSESPALDLTVQPKNIAWKMLVGDLNLTSSEHAPATPGEQRALLWAWMLNTFYASLARTKPLLLALGPTHSGKTTAMRRLARVLENMDSDVSELSTDKQDSLRASFANHHVLVVDNLEKSGSKWLADMLNRISTGSTIELRELYHTNKLYSVKPECFVAMTAVTLPFSEETVYNRLLVLAFEQLRKMIPESVIQNKLKENYNDIWIDLLTDLNKVSRVLQNGFMKTANQQSETRLADFELFCQAVIKAGICQEDLPGGLKTLPQQQQHALAANSPFIIALEMWLEAAEDAAEPRSVGDLLNTLMPIGRSLKDSRWLWTSPQGLSRHLDVLETRLVSDFGCKIAEVHDGKGKTTKRYSFPKG